jgi:hypothetical protein
VNPVRNFVKDVAAYLPCQQIIGAANRKLALAGVRRGGKDVIGASLSRDGRVVSHGIVASEPQRLRLLAIERWHKKNGECGKLQEDSTHEESLSVVKGTYIPKYVNHA